MARIRELWERNLSQREILRVLNEEDGFDISHRELMRVRAKNRWLLRMPNPLSVAGDPPDLSPGPTGLGAPVPESADQPVLSPSPADDGEASENALSPQVVAKRRDQLHKLEAQSAERWETRKRRRRTRAWAGLPADPPGPPRFPSETTIEEGRVILSLDNALYREVRSRFADICNEAGVAKKTIAGPKRWDAVKQTLIQAMPHLQSVLWASKDNADNKKLALDVICTDVTKRMRTAERKMTIAEAKSLLQINPEESRSIRHDFLAILQRDHFTNKVEAGQEHWDELKGTWISASPILQRLLAAGPDDPAHGEKLRAVEVMAKDVMKRLRDEQTRRDASRQKSTSIAPSGSGGDSGQQTDKPAPPPPKLASPGGGQVCHGDYHQPEQMQLDGMVTALVPDTPGGPPSIHMNHCSSPLQIQAHPQVQSPGIVRTPGAYQGGFSGSSSFSEASGQGSLLPSNGVNAGLSMDGTMDGQLNASLSVLMDDAGVLGAHTHGAHAEAFLGHGLSPGPPSHHAYVQPHFPPPPPNPPRAAPVAVFFRLDHSTSFTLERPVWIGTLEARTFNELRHVAVMNSSVPSAVCGRVKGILGAEVAIEITRDDELTAYLAVIEGSGGTGAASFWIQLMPTWKA